MAIARERVVVVVERESRIMDYNAPPNSCTLGKAQLESEISSGLSNYTAPLRQTKSVYICTLLIFETSYYVHTTIQIIDENEEKIF